MAPKNGILLRTGAAGLALALMWGTAVVAPAAPRPAGQTTGQAETRAAETGDRLTLKEAGREFLSDGVQTFAGKHAWVGDVSPVVTEMGGLAGFAAAGVFFGAGLIFKDARARDTGYLAASAILQSFLVDSFLKSMAGRQRPSVAGGEDHWSGPAGFFERFEKGQGAFYTSFPSGHAAAAFSLATVIALQYRHHAWVPVVAYTIAAGVGLSRMTMDRHWASDVAIGAVVSAWFPCSLARAEASPSAYSSTWIRRPMVPALADLKERMDG